MGKHHSPEPPTTPQGKGVLRVLNDLCVPDSTDDPNLSKVQYIESRLLLINDQQITAIVGTFLDSHGQSLATKSRFNLEEFLWTCTPHITISKRIRYEMARALDGVPIYIRHEPFIDLIRRLWEQETHANTQY